MGRYTCCRGCRQDCSSTHSVILTQEVKKIYDPLLATLYCVKRY